VMLSRRKNRTIIAHDPHPGKLPILLNIAPRDLLDFALRDLRLDSTHLDSSMGSPHSQGSVSTRQPWRRFWGNKGVAKR